MTQFGSNTEKFKEKNNYTQQDPDKENTQPSPKTDKKNQGHIPNNTFGDSVNDRIIGSSGRSTDDRLFYQSGKY